MKRLLLPFVAFTFFGCTQIKEKAMIEIQNHEAGMFTHRLNLPEYTLNNDTITISSGAKSDFFNSPDGLKRVSNAPLLLKEIDNTKPFTFTAKVKAKFASTYDAGALYLFSNEKLWQKIAFEIDERGITRLVTVRTIGTSDDNNHDPITQEDVYLRISSDTKNLGFYYSLDGLTWQLLRLHVNEYPDKVYIALSSQSPLGEGMEAQFTEIKLTDNHVKNFRFGL